MAFIADAAYDAALDWIRANTNQLVLCSSEPASYAASTAAMLAHKDSPTLGANDDRLPDGRKLTVAAFTDGSVTAVGTATHWALRHTGTSTLAATGKLTEPILFEYAGKVLILNAIDVGVKDAIDG